MKKLLAAALLASVAAGPASAASITYSLLDLLQTGNYGDNNTSQTFAGTGFVGVYNPGYNIGFGHLLGLENGGSKTAAQVDIAALAGKTINSATLSFVLSDGSSGGATMVVTGYDTAGALGYQWDTPVAGFGQISTPITGLSANSADITSIVANAVTGGGNWLGLHLQQGDGGYLWTYTYTGYGATADSAQLRLTVDYDEVPEPAMLGLFGLGALGLGLARRRKA